VEEHSSISNSEPVHATEIAHTLGAIDTDPDEKGAVVVYPDHVPHRDRSRIPWALLLSLLILAGFELAIHLVHWPRHMPYELGLGEYYAVAATLDQHGPAEVTVIGSSRAREGFDMPLLRSEIDRMTRKRVVVANYAVGGARAYLFEAIARRVLRSKHPPRVIVIGSAERDFGSDPTIDNLAPIYWNLADWRQAWGRRGAKTLDDLPTVAWNYVDRFYFTLRYREQIKLQIQNFLNDEKDRATQLEGNFTPWQRTSHRSLLHQAPPVATLIHYVATLAVGTYPNPEQLGAMERLARACQAAHVRLIVCSMPIPPLLEKYVSPKVESAYRQEESRLCAQSGATFITPGQLDMELTDREFRDPSHLDIFGAKKLTAAVAKYIAQDFGRSDAQN
jgi:hypothetical protein